MDTTTGITRPEIPRMSLRRAAALQLLPGMGNLLLFIPLAWLFGQIGLSSFIALGVVLLFAEVPISWYLMVREVRREQGHFSLKAAFPWVAKIPLWQYFAIGLPLILFGMVMIGGITPVISSAIRAAVAPDLPTWFLLEPDPEAFMSMSRSALVAMWLTMLLVFSGVGGITQELFSRGFLLPRTAHIGAIAPAFNALMFGVMHLNAPWSWPGFFLLALPWAYLTWWKRSMKLGLLGHVGMLLAQSAMMSLLVFGLVDPARMMGG